MSNTFTCAVCDRTFEKAWTDAEAQAESDARFGPSPNGMMGVACDDCTKGFDAWLAANVGDPRPGAITFEGRKLMLGDKLHCWVRTKPVLWTVLFVGNMREHANALGFAAVNEGNDEHTCFREVDLQHFKRAEN